MQTIESLKKQIESAEDLESIVRTMKALAAVNIRQYERAVEALSEYMRTIELGLQAVLQKRVEKKGRSAPHASSRVGAVVFGSDQGMCGQLNDQIVSHTLATLDNMNFSREGRSLLAVGERTKARLEDSGLEVQETFSVPGSSAGITAMVQEMLVRIEEWYLEVELDRILLFFSKPRSGAFYRPHTVHLLPLDESWLRRLKEKPWPTRILPIFTMEWDPLFSSLVRQYFFVSLYSAFAQSLASENASRLASMQGAEKNIRERLSELVQRFHRLRQESITEELLDIVSGFEALTPRRV